jgi:hypothetical protein
MRVSEEPVCIYHFRQNPAFPPLHLRSSVHVVSPEELVESPSRTEEHIQEGGNLKRGTTTQKGAIERSYHREG